MINRIPRNVLPYENPILEFSAGNPTDEALYNSYTCLDRTVVVPNNATVQSIAFYNEYALNGMACGIFTEDGGSLYTCKKWVPANHGGTGWEWFDLSAPFVTNSGSTYRVGVYQPASTPTVLPGCIAGIRANISGAFTEGQQKTAASENAYKHPTFKVKYIKEVKTGAGAYTGAASIRGYTVLDRAIKLTPGSVINWFGMYYDAATVWAGYFYVIQRDSEGLYTPKYKQPFQASSAGWKWLKFNAPYTVPGSGDFHLAVYAKTTGNLKQNSGVARAVRNSEMNVGVQTTMVEANGSYLLGCRWS